MWSRTPRQTSAPGKSRRAALLWALLVSLVFGMIDFGEPIENVLRGVRNASHQREASGDVVVLAIDERSIEGLSDWPWPRRRYADIVDSLTALDAKEIAFSLSFSTRTTKEDDRRLQEALGNAGNRVVLPFRTTIDPPTGQPINIMPLPEFRRSARLANIYLYYNFQNHVRRLSYATVVDGAVHPTLAARLAERSGAPGEMFTIDYSTRLASIPRISALDLLQGRVRPEQIAGKRVIIGVTSIQESNNYFIPGSALAPEVFVHALAAETLMRGRPVEIGWLIPLLATIALLTIHLYAARGWASRLAAGAAAVIIFVVPFSAESRLIFFDIVPATVAFLIIVSTHAWSEFRHSYRARGMTNAVSGLPNLNAARETPDADDKLLVAMRVHNFAEITSALAPGSEKMLVEQIVARLAMGAGGATIYQGDEGIFIWLVPKAGQGDPGDQLEALHALCRTPVAVLAAHVDLVVTFGVDAGDRSVPSRIGSALVAADEAHEEGMRWKQFDANRLKDAAWKLSLLGRLDAAIDDGEIWVAYQPKLDLATRRLIGAEALVRWSHPEKGEISPIEFIPAAEQNNRIEKLTAHVLADAVRAAAAINARGIDFGVAVNLSARLLDGFDVVERVERLLDIHRLPAGKLTLEVTESLAMASNERSFEVLDRLRALGVNISIDDYGTGFSTLEYLKKIPATEIKIDKGFIRMIDRNQSDKLMVNSTIQLAHSLGRKVVAEGVETPEILDALAAMGCDDAQGYLIGKPMPIRNLVKMLIAEYRRNAA